MHPKSALIDSLTSEFLAWQKDPPPRAQMRTQLSSLIESDRARYQRPQSRYVTVMMADIRGFTALTSCYPPETVVALLNQYFAVMVDIIVRHEGVVDKFMGDGIMAVFGLQAQLAGDVDKAIACAVAMQQSMPAVNRYCGRLGVPPLFIGIGLSTGRVIAADIGSNTHREHTVVGEPVNLAARIEAHSLRGQVLISQSSWQHAQSYIEVGEPSTIYIKGKREPVTIYELLETRRPSNMTVPRAEERKGPRVAVNIPLAFQQISGATVMPKAHYGEIIDLGYNGMRARLPIYLEPYTDIKFPLSTAQADDSSTDVYAKVLRTNITARDQVTDGISTYTSSLEFTSIAPRGQASLRAFIDRLLA